MKLHIVSDLHLEFGKWPKDHDINRIDADVTILAGDIGIGLQGLEWALSIRRPVIYVMGNHEFYGQRAMPDLWRKARQKVTGSHVHLLENESVVIASAGNPQERVRFLGATLWTDFQLLGEQWKSGSMARAAERMTDYLDIFVGRRRSTISEPGMARRHVGARLTPAHTVALHEASRAYLEAELERTPQGWTNTVVVTHHAPSGRSLDPRRSGSPLSAAYASNLESMVAAADLWVHGHSHYRTDYELAPGIGRVLCNPRGYVGEEPVREFDPNLVVEI